MNPLAQRLNRFKGKFSSADQKIADHLLRAYPGFLLQTGSDIARTLGLSVATVSRFFPKIGFASLRQAYAELRAEAEFLTGSPLDRYHQRGHFRPTGGGLPAEVMAADLSNLEQTLTGLDASVMAQVIDLLADPGRRIFVQGERKVFALAYYLFLQLAAIRDKITLVRSDNSAFIEMVLGIKPGDVLLLFDFRRYHRLTSRLAQAALDQGGLVAAVTDSPLAASAQLASLVLTVATHGVSAFDSYTAGMGLINLILAEVVQRLGPSVKVRIEEMEQVYRRFDIWSWQAPLARKLPE
jgi:DNA-binding MurR/RpiR family transcriptional regulator